MAYFTSWPFSFYVYKWRKTAVLTCSITVGKWIILSFTKCWATGIESIPVISTSFSQCHHPELDEDDKQGKGMHMQAPCWLKCGPNSCTNNLQACYTEASVSSSSTQKTSSWSSREPMPSTRFPVSHSGEIHGAPDSNLGFGRLREMTNKQTYQSIHILSPSSIPLWAHQSYSKRRYKGIKLQAFCNWNRIVIILYSNVCLIELTDTDKSELDLLYILNMARKKTAPYLVKGHSQ